MTAMFMLSGLRPDAGAPFPTLPLLQIASWNPEIAETLPATSAFTRTSVAQLLTTTDGTTFWYQSVKSGEVRFAGMRRQENLLALASTWELFDTVTETDLGNNITQFGNLQNAANDRATKRVTSIANEGTRVAAYVEVRGTAGEKISFQVKRNSGGPFVGASISNVVLTADFVPYYIGEYTALAGNDGFQFQILNNVGDDANVIEIRNEGVSFVTGAPTNSVPDLVNDGIIYNSNVLGVQYFNTIAANTSSPATGGVITPATGAVITGGGYLSETTATNQILESSDIADPAWTKANLSAGTQNVEDIGLAGNTLNAGVAVGVAHTATAVVSSSATRTAYAIAKAGTGQFLTIRSSATADEYAVFDLTNGTITETGAGATSRIIDLTGGWYKCQVSSDTGTGTTMLLGISDTGTPGQADPSFNGASETILVHHVQFENTSFCTSPIITDGGALARAVDLMTDSTQVTTELSAVCDVTIPTDQADSTNLNILDITGSDIPLFYRSDGAGTKSIRAFMDNVIPTIINDILGERHKLAMSCKVGTDTLILVDDESNSSNGSPGSDTWAGATLAVGNSSSGGDAFRGIIHSYILYEVSQTQQQLESLVA